MKVVVAMDSFKGSLGSYEAGLAVKEGIQRACRDADVVVKPLADGGEGTVKSLIEGLGGRCVTAEVTGPVGQRIAAKYGILADGRTAVMEMAEAAGITLVKKEDLNPWKASTTGVGEMILDAACRGCRAFLIGIGGSATTEGGIGMLQALGYVFYDEEGKVLPPAAESLGRISRISKDHVPEVLEECRFLIACDVSNPLCGENGAVCVYGPQKGVKEEDKEKLDVAMRHYAEKTAAFTGKENSRAAGAGAAGGLGFAFLSYFADAELKSGISVVLEAVGLEKEVKNADIVVTGEGRLDAQTAMGKAPAGVAKLAKQYGCTVLAFAGSVSDDAGACNEEGIDAFFPVIRGITTLEEAMKEENARKNIALSAEQVFRLLGTYAV
ncbi:MAG TPA: glycerate kinase [Candidatus Choladousia intestinipullorum]|nr:glycerate kinase [Candidatus Choladousia intestinipullorum]